MQNPASFSSQLKTLSNPAWTKVEDRAGTVKFASRLATPDSEDWKWNFRQAQIDKSTGATKAGIAEAPEEFFDYLERKKDTELYAQYQAWAIKQADMSTPESRAYWNKILSWVANKREALVDEQADIQKRLAKLKIHGIQSEDDMMFIFALNQGMINVADKALYKLDDADQSAYGDKEENKFGGKYTAGIFSPYRKFFSDDKHEVKWNQVSLSETLPDTRAALAPGGATNWFNPANIFA